MSLCWLFHIVLQFPLHLLSICFILSFIAHTCRTWWCDSLYRIPIKRECYFRLQCNFNPTNTVCSMSCWRSPSVGLCGPSQCLLRVMLAENRPAFVFSNVYRCFKYSVDSVYWKLYGAVFVHVLRVCRVHWLLSQLYMVWCCIDCCW